MRADMNRDEVMKALEAVIDPELRRSIVELGHRCGKSTSPPTAWST